MGADASLTSDQIEQAIAGDVKNAVTSVFNGKPKIIFESGDALKIMEAVKAAITRLDIGSLGIDSIKAAEITVNAFIGASVTNAPDAIAAKIVAAIQKAYNTAASGT
jgi:GGDEF domain-containing protein